MDVPAVSVEELRDMLASAAPPLVIDVREKREYDIARLPTSRLIPLGELPQHLSSLPKDRKIILHCHHGGRSARATELLMQQGFADVHNLDGGIHAWAQRIDPQVKTY